VENVDDHFEVIEHDPLARRETVDRRGASPVIFAQARFNFASNRFQLRLGAGGTDDEEVSKAGNSGEIENDDVFGFLVGSEVGAGRG
jgi:hypothetical protein